MTRIRLVYTLCVCMAGMFDCGCTFQSQATRSPLKYPVPSPEWVRQWLAVDRSPLYAEGILSEQGLFEAHWGHRRFENAWRCGDYDILEGFGMALIVRNGKAVWGGTAVVPVRHNGAIARLLLLKSPQTEVWPESGVFECHTLIMNGTTGKIQPDSFVFMPPLHPRKWVADLDNDGSDEVAKFELKTKLNKEASLAGAVSDLEWTLNVSNPCFESGSWDVTLHIPKGLSPQQFTLVKQGDSLGVRDDLHQKDVGVIRIDKNKPGLMFQGDQQYVTQGINGDATLLLVTPVAPER